jgi:hypothetical protein
VTKRKIDKGLASSQSCKTNDFLNKLRMNAFKTNSPADKENYFTALNLAFQRGDLIAYELVETTNT